MVGVFRVKVRIFSLQDESLSREVEMVVDTGANYPVIPRSVAFELGIRTVEQRRFTLANGDTIERDIGWVGLECEGRLAATLVILGQPRDPPLLGALALEALGLDVDPQQNRLRPATQWLLATP